MVTTTGQRQSCSGVGLIETDMQSIVARRMLRLERQEDGFDDDFAGLPEGGGILAVIGGGVVLAVNLPIRADELDETGQVG